MRSVGLVLVFLCSLVGCIEPTSKLCANGTTCPSTDECSPVGGCVKPEQLTACTPAPDNGLCMLPGGGAGACYSGVCLPIGCGNGVVEPGERCDDGNTTAGDGCSATCDSDERCGNGVLDVAGSEGCDCGDAALSDALRPSACAGQPNGSQTGSRCTADCQIVGCGDGVVGGLEDCDGADLDSKACTDIGFYSGTLACSPSCKFDVAACTGRCGDGTQNGPASAESCDGADLGGATCLDFGYYQANGLGCNAVCGFDTTACIGRCNDGMYQAGFEACDPVETAQDLTARNVSCTNFGFYQPGGLACGASCQFDTTGCGGGTCGDATVNGSEDCDGTQLAGKTCKDFGYHVTGNLACRGNCTYDFAGCSERCGDGILNGPEECDGTALGGKTCSNFGYYQASGLACNAACAYDTTSCQHRCGDGVIDAQEQCDGSVPVGWDCTDFGFYATTTLTCTNCAFDFSSCSGGTCGDNTVQSAEDCEPSLGAGAFDCTDYGFYQAAGLACTNACNHETSACKEWCGDGAVNGPEPCDGAPPAAYACASSTGGYSGGQLSCTGGCSTGTDHCHRIGFQEESPGTASAIRDVWGSGDELFAATATEITHTLGGAWSSMQGSGAANGVWGSSVTNVYAVGAPISGSTWGLQRYAGSSWSPIAPGVAGTVVELRKIHGLGASDFWAVGDTGTALHYTGSWSRPSTGQTAKLNDVFAVSATEAFIVGDGGVRLRWTGGSTFTNSAGTGNYLAVWGRSATEVYAVNDAGAVTRWNGSAWSAAGTCGAKLRGVGGLPGPSVAFVAGEDASGRGIVCQLAGGTWHPLALGVQPALNVVGGSDRRVAVGGTGTILTSEGANWLDDIESRINMTIEAIWGSSATNLYVAGQIGSNEGIKRWDGTAWTTQTMSSPTIPRSLYAIFGGTGWAVACGQYSRIWGSNGTGGAWTLQYDGGVNATLYAAWGDSANVYVVGEGPALLQRATGGTTWTPQTIPAPASGGVLQAIWGVPGGPVFAVGSNGTILRNTSGTWTAMTSGTTADLFSVWGRSATDVYAAGGAGVILHYDGVGTTWKRVAVDTSAPSGAMASTATDMFVGSGPNLRELIGGRWLPLVLKQADHVVVSMFGLPDLLVFADYNYVTALAGRTWTRAASELRCDDVWDDDGDGRTDCADSDCAASSACADPGGCHPITTLSCGQTTSATTVGGATRWPYYGAGCVARNNTGPEAYFRVRRSTAGNIQLNLTGYTGDLDLIVSGTTGAACTPDQSCLASSQLSSGTSESLTLAAAANTDYIVIIDGAAGAASAFQLQAVCP